MMLSGNTHARILFDHEFLDDEFIVTYDIVQP